MSAISYKLSRLRLYLSISYNLVVKLSNVFEASIVFKGQMRKNDTVSTSISFHNRKSIRNKHKIISYFIVYIYSSYKNYAKKGGTECRILGMRLKSAPESFLRIAKRQRGPQYYHRMDPKNFTGTYIAKSDYELARKLAHI